MAGLMVFRDSQRGEMMTRTVSGTDFPYLKPRTPLAEAKPRPA